MICPPIQIDCLNINKKKLLVVRDDLLEGGTKQRAAVPFLNYFKKEGVKEFIYASPFSGYAQIALSISANSVGVDSTIFASVNEKKEISSYSNKASKYSKIISCENLDAAERLSSFYQKNTKDSLKIPLGFNHCLFVEFLQKELEKQIKMIGKFNRLWVSVGSGTLAKTLRKIIPEKRLICVDVRVLKEDDERIVSVKKMSNLSYYRAFEEFKSPCCILPPIPSNLFYDSKLWRFLEEFVEDGDVWWNVAS